MPGQISGGGGSISAPCGWWDAGSALRGTEGGGGSISAVYIEHRLHINGVTGFLKQGVRCLEQNSWLKTRGGASALYKHTIYKNDECCQEKNKNKVYCAMYAVSRDSETQLGFGRNSDFVENMVLDKLHTFQSPTE